MVDGSVLTFIVFMGLMLPIGVSGANYHFKQIDYSDERVQQQVQQEIATKPYRSTRMNDYYGPEEFLRVAVGAYKSHADAKEAPKEMVGVAAGVVKNGDVEGKENLRRLFVTALRHLPTGSFDVNEANVKEVLTGLFKHLQETASAEAKKHAAEWELSPVAAVMVVKGWPEYTFYTQHLSPPFEKYHELGHEVELRQLVLHFKELEPASDYVLNQYVIQISKDKQYGHEEFGRVAVGAYNEHGNEVATVGGVVTRRTDDAKGVKRLVLVVFDTLFYGERSRGTNALSATLVALYAATLKKVEELTNGGKLHREMVYLTKHPDTESYFTDHLGFEKEDLAGNGSMTVLRRDFGHDD